MKPRIYFIGPGARRLHSIWCKNLVAFLALLCLGYSPASAMPDCKEGGSALYVSRVIEIDASQGPVFGAFTKQPHQPSFLRPKEVVLTFDDGPMPWVTKSILDTLDKACAKATFFSVGEMALAYPSVVKEVAARGHTIASHTYTHPLNVARMNQGAAIDEIENGLAAVATAAGVPIAPFFRFPGLSDSARLVSYLQKRNIATFTVDVVSNDSYIHDPEKLVQRTMAAVRANHGGIILFHDIKTATAKALPDILAKLQSEGFTLVHLTSKHPAEPLDAAMRAVAPKLANAGKDVGQRGADTGIHGKKVEDGPAGRNPIETSSIGQQANRTADARRANQAEQGGVSSGDRMLAHSKSAAAKSGAAKSAAAAKANLANWPPNWETFTSSEPAGPPVNLERRTPTTGASHRIKAPNGWKTSISDDGPRQSRN